MSDQRHETGWDGVPDSPWVDGPRIAARSLRGDLLKVGKLIPDQPRFMVWINGRHRANFFLKPLAMKWAELMAGGNPR